MASCLLSVLGFLVLACRAVPQGEDDLDFQRNLPAETVWAVSGEDALLPCDVSAPAGDRINTVFWFKDATGIPLYSLDARGKDLSKATHLATGDELGTRSYFITGGQENDNRGKLKIARVTVRDEGVFRCRVDFFNSPTRNYKVNLTLIEPPGRPLIMDAQGNEVAAAAGPFYEGYDLQMSCHVAGGRPQPMVSWWHEGSLVDNISETTTDNIVVNRLFLATVHRSLRGTQFECRANQEEARPLVKKVVLEVFLKPVTVKIVTPNEMLSAGKSRQLMCESTGSFPPAKVTWLLDGEPLKHAAIMSQDDENSTRSTLILRPDEEDNGKELACRAENPKFRGGIIEDRRYIRVAYPPIPSITLGSAVGVEELKEGDNIQLICEVRANPEVQNIKWYHNNILILRDESSRVVPLNNLTRASSGSYVCVATNQEGTVASIPIHIKVQFAPVCKPGHESIAVGALRHETLTAKCEVLADPGGDSLRFSWTYRKAKDVLPVPGSRVSKQGHVSTIQFTPVSELDFGTLACWATNPIGQQKEPCLVQIVHANVPESPHDCKLHNTTAGRLEVICIPGADGGLPQHFVLLVSESEGLNDQAAPGVKPGLAPLYRVFGSDPKFVLHSLEPGNEYRIQVYAQNAMGVSNPPVVLNGVRVTTAMEKLTRDDNEDPSILSAEYWPSLLLFGVLIGATCIILGVVFLTITVVTCRRRTFPGTVPSPSDLRLNNIDSISEDAKKMRPRSLRSETQIQDEGGGY
uniref:Uncharacterized protein n=1 Tax=Clastoptera arizonana TaxID=38151 RepID=A0A1B6C275_9HEMI